MVTPQLHMAMNPGNDARVSVDALCGPILGFGAWTLANRGSRRPDRARVVSVISGSYSYLSASIGSRLAAR